MKSRCSRIAIFVDVARYDMDTVKHAEARITANAVVQIPTSLDGLLRSGKSQKDSNMLRRFCLALKTDQGLITPA